MTAESEFKKWQIHKLLTACSVLSAAELKTMVFSEFSGTSTFDKSLQVYVPLTSSTFVASTFKIIL